MRALTLLGAAALTFMLSGGGPAEAAAWCAYYTGGRFGPGGTNCGFYSFEQCMANAWGNGGFCRQNQFENSYWGGRAAQQRNRRSD